MHYFAAILDLAATAQASIGLGCYQTQALCEDNHLTDCKYYADKVLPYCGQITKAKRNEWCYKTEELCDSQLNDCEYTPDNTEFPYCGLVWKKSKRDVVNRKRRSL